MNSFSPMLSSSPKNTAPNTRSVALTCSDFSNLLLTGTSFLMLITLSCLYDFHGRFTHDSHGRTASVFQNIHRIVCSSFSFQT